MKLQRCALGHYYNGDKFIQCPHCAGNQKSRSLYDDSQRKIVTVQRRKKMPAVSKERTAGWLVCLTEPRCGKSYPLLEGTNWIGAGRKISVALTTELEPDGALLARIECNPETGGATLFFFAEEAALTETEIALKSQQQIQIGDFQFVYVKFENKNYWK